MLITKRIIINQLINQLLKSIERVRFTIVIVTCVVCVCVCVC